MKKRLAALLLALCTLLSLLPASALATARGPGGGGHGGGGPATSTQTTKVYVYTQIEGMTDDELKNLTLNAHGWYTLGYVEVTYTGELTLEKVKAAMASGFVHEYNTSIRISDVEFNNLIISNGADDYVPTGTYAYHLDGKLTVTAQYGFVTIKHEGTDGTTLLTEQSVPYRAGTTLTFGQDYSSHSFSGYTYDHNSDSSYTVVADQNKVITLYYQPVTDLSYTVRYLEQGTDKVLHEEKTVQNQTFGATVTEKPVQITGYITPSEQELAIGLENNVITFYYEKDATQTQDVSYEVRYTVAGVLRSEETVTVSDQIWVNDPVEIAIAEGGIPAPADKFPGYVLDSENPAYPAAGTKVASGTVFTVNYVPRTDLSYTVRYLEQGTDKVLHEEKTVQNQTFGATVTEEPVQITGYITPSQQQLTIGLENNVITFYYQRDNGQTKTLSYTVQYYKDGQLQENDTLLVTGNVWVNAPDTIVIRDGSVFTDANKYPGYVLSATSDRYATGDSVASGSVFKVYYTARTDLSYTVRYLEQGTNKVLHEEKTVQNQTFGATVTEEPVQITGYVTPSEQQLTIGLENNVITFYYEKDATQTQDVSYEVRYTVAGVLRSEETVTVTESIWVNDPAEIAIAEGGIPAPADKFPGYVLDSENPAYPAAGTKVASGTVFTVNYVPRTDLSYTVRYLEQGTDKVLHEDKTVQNQTFGATVTEEPVQITGYVTPSQQQLTIGLENNVITFYYQRDNGQTKTLSYTVQYYKDGQLQENDTLLVTGNVWVNAPDTIVIRDGSVFTDANKYPGYVLSTTSDRYATGDSVASGSVFKVYYTARTDLSYTVRYLEQGTNKVLHEEKTVQNQTFGATVTEEPVQITGYVTPSQQQLTIGLENNVITFYYEKDAAQTQDVSYEVRYTVAGVLRSEETVTVTDQIWVNDPAEIAIAEGGIPAPADKFPGYVLDSENPAYPAAGAKVDSGTIFTVNYVPRTDLSYTVRYLEQGTDAVLADSKVVTGQTFGAIVTESPIAIDGYAPTETSSVELRIGTEKNEIIFYYTAVPATPADPAAPVTPVSPVTPDSPAAPVTPATPDSTPESPAAPVSPADTIQPTTEEIIDDETPLAGPAGGAWALLNLILTAVTVALSAALLVGYLGKSKQAREDENGNTVYDENGNEVLEYIRKKRGFWRVVSLIPAIGAVIAFILTENMLLPMVIVDRWTLLMVAIALVQVVITALSKKHDEEQEENNNAAC